MPATLCGFNDGPGGRGCDLLVQFGPTLVVNIGFDPEFKANQTGPPLAGVTDVHALVDTGATSSCIDSGLAVSLNLPIVDRQAVAGVGGRHDVNMHLAQIHVPTLRRTIYGTFAGVDLAEGGQPHVALIGRTFLRPFALFYDGRTGTVTITDDLPIAVPLPGPTVPLLRQALDRLVDGARKCGCRGRRGTQERLRQSG
jgi:hypothetical protein